MRGRFILSFYDKNIEYSELVGVAMDKPAMVYLLSDSVGETAEYVIKAVATQFRSPFEIKRFPYIKSIKDIEQAILMAKENSAIVAYTLVVPDLKEYIDQKSYEYGVEAVDLLEPLLNAFKKKTEEEPINEPMLMRKLDKKYFRKVEAIEFAVKYDDGRDARGVVRADIVLVGVSRTSKTPLSQYLAHKRLKVANVPLVPEVKPPDELFKVSAKKCIGLTISPEKLIDIRAERLKALGLQAEATYANINRIKEELVYAQKIMERIGCPVIDVSNKAVEETANQIYNMFQKRR